MAALDTATVMNLIYVLLLFVGIGVSSLVLKFIAKRMSFREQEYRYALFAAVVSMAAALLIPLLALMVMQTYYDMITTYASPLLLLVIDALLVKYAYGESWKTSIKATFGWWICNVIISLLIGLILAVPFLYAMGVI